MIFFSPFQDMVNADKMIYNNDIRLWGDIMKIKILGSGGGEGFPAPFCNCEHCETARKMGNKSLRSMHQAIINDDLLIDFPIDTNSHCLRFSLNLGKLQNVLITHSHPDHYVPHLGL